MFSGQNEIIVSKTALFGTEIFIFCKCFLLLPESQKEEHKKQITSYPPPHSIWFIELNIVILQPIYII